MPPPRPGSGRATPIVRFAQDLRTSVEGRCIWGLTPPHAPRVNAGRLIPNNARPGIKQVQKTLKNSVECLGSWRRGFWMWGLCFVGLLAPRPRQHGMLHPKGCSFKHKDFAGLQGVWFGHGGLRRPHAPT